MKINIIFLFFNLIKANALSKNINYLENINDKQIIFKSNGFMSKKDCESVRKINEKALSYWSSMWNTVNLHYDKDASNACKIVQYEQSPNLKWITEQGLWTGFYYIGTEFIMKRGVWIAKDAVFDCLITKGKVPGMKCGDGQ